MVWHRRILSEGMFATALKYAVVDQIRLNSNSFTIHNERNVITLDNLIVPDSREKQKRNISTNTLLKHCCFIQITTAHRIPTSLYSVLKYSMYDTLCITEICNMLSSCKFKMQVICFES